jgi:hypothetical protein
MFFLLAFCSAARIDCDSITPTQKFEPAAMTRWDTQITLATTSRGVLLAGVTVTVICILSVRSWKKVQPKRSHF